jgi:TonB family protein
LPDLRVRQLPTPRSRPRIHVLRRPWAASAIAHLVIIALICLLRITPSVPPPDDASFTVEFSPDATQAPPGPPTPSQLQPQINLTPPEYQQAPPAESQDAEPIPLPRPMQRPHYAGSTAHNNPFAHPQAYSLAPREQQSPASAPNSRGLYLSAGPVIRNGRLADSAGQTEGAHAAEDYMALVRDFVEAHKYYPGEAARNEEQGSATVEVTVRHDGKVIALTLLSGSGSHLLDDAWLGVFRDNRMPVFFDDMPPQITFSFTLDYYLIYR